MFNWSVRRTANFRHIAPDEIAAAHTVLSVLLLDDGLEVVVDLTAHPHSLRERRRPCNHTDFTDTCTLHQDYICHKQSLPPWTTTPLQPHRLHWHMYTTSDKICHKQSSPPWTTTLLQPHRLHWHMYTTSELHMLQTIMASVNDNAPATTRTSLTHVHYIRITNNHRLRERWRFCNHMDVTDTYMYTISGLHMLQTIIRQDVLIQYKQVFYAKNYRSIPQNVKMLYTWKFRFNTCICAW